VHLDEPAHERQSDAEPSLRMAGALSLGEEIEHPGQQLLRDAHAVIGDGQPELAMLPPFIVMDRRRHVDVTLRIRELRGIVQQVCEHLDKPRPIHVEDARFFRQSNSQRDPALGDERVRGLDGTVNEFGQRCGLPLELDLAGRNA